MAAFGLDLTKNLSYYTVCAFLPRKGTAQRVRIATTMHMPRLSLTSCANFESMQPSAC